MNERPKLTAMMESAQRVAASVPSWMLDTKQRPANAGKAEPERGNAGSSVSDRRRPEGSGS